MASLSARFGEVGFGTIEIDGLSIHPMLRASITPGQRVVVTWISAVNSERKQGLSLRVQHPTKKGSKSYAGLLRRGGDAPAFRIWSDLEPSEVEFEVLEVTPPGELWVSNVWEMPNGRVDEWFEDYGILISEEGEGRYVLHCNDGLSKPLDFDDLVVRIQIVS